MCDFDPTCCDLEWDATCAEIAADDSFCGSDGIADELGEHVLHVASVTGSGGDRRLDGVTVRRGNTDDGRGAGLLLVDGGLDIVSFVLTQIAGWDL